MCLCIAGCGAGYYLVAEMMTETEALVMNVMKVTALGLLIIIITTT